MNSSLTSGADRRDTCTKSPLSLSSLKPGASCSTRLRGSAAVVHEPKVVLPGARMQLAGTSSTKEVTFLSASVLGWELRGPSGFAMLTRSKTSPRLTAKPSWRWPTKTRPGCAQPGMLMLWMNCWA